MKHLALITDAWRPQINGVVTTLVQTVDRLRSRGWQVTVIHPGMFKTVSAPGYSEIKLALNPWKLRSLLKELRPTHVHIAVEGPLGTVARILMKRWRWQYTTAYHTNFPEYLYTFYKVPTSITIPLVKWFHQYSSAILTPSVSTAGKLNRWGLTKTVVWGRGYDETIFYPDKRENEQLELLYVGRVSDEKNIGDFLRLQKPGRRLTVVGDGPARQRLEKEFPEAVFVGFKQGKELAAYYQQADVFVFPSRSDTLGVVMIEAIACGTPVAAYRVEGPIDVVRPGINGYLHATDLETCVQLASCIDRSVVALSAKKFSWETSCDTFESQLVVTSCKPVTI